LSEESDTVIDLLGTPGLKYSEDPDLWRELRDLIRVFGVPQTRRETDT
jgi:hypothetical protein